MPATSPEAIAAKRARMYARRKERRASDPDYRQRETKARTKRARTYRRKPASIEARAAKRETARAIARTKQDGRPFVGCDGEGIGREPHRYALFRMGTRELFAQDAALSTADLLAFIVAHPDPGELLVGYAFDYDVNMILKDLPEDRWRHLLMLPPRPDHDAHLQAWRRHTGIGEKIAANPYTGIGWTWARFGVRLYGIQYIPRNHFRVCEGVTLLDRGDYRTVAKPGTTRTIFDTIGFFQSTFLVALNRWNVGREHWPAIKAGKDGRADFSTITPAIKKYCAIECDLLAQLMEQFRSACLGAGIRPRTWNGAGKLAAAMMRDNGVIRKKDVDLLPAGLRLAAHHAYYGGRFEVTRCGLVDRPVHEFDIRSAYPAAMLELPCLDHGTWAKASGHELGELPADALFVCGVQFKHPAKNFLCGLPFRSRKDGTLSWPRDGRGTYWSPEIRSAQALGATVKLGEGWRYEKRCDCRPFQWIDRVYQERRQLEAIGDGRGVPLKLGPNSVYGKWAQRIGNPPYANPIYAGLCTAITRAKLNYAIRSAGQRNVIMLATDAVYTIGRPPALPIGDELGEWEHKEHRSLFIVRPGVYWPPKKRGAAQKVKSRGVSEKFLAPMVPKFRRVWSDYVRRYKAGARDSHLFAKFTRAILKAEGIRPLPAPVVPVTITAFIGHRLALHQGKLDEACRWIEREQRQAFECHNSTKRWAGRIFGKAMILPPRQGDEFSKSHTYRPDSLLITEQPLPTENMMLLEAMPDLVDLTPPHTD